MQSLLFIFITLIILLLPSLTQARTTPQDIINSQKEVYNQKLNSYSPEGKNKVSEFDKKIAALNQKQTTELEALMVYQGEILDEYMRRHNLLDRQSDGISRNLQDPVENARYWLTFAHEAVAYQAAKIYILNLSGETNIKRDVQNTANTLQNDISILKNKVLKSQGILETLVAKE
jgi:hypothetical protein